MSEAAPRPAVSYGWSRAAGFGLSFRPVTDADLPFLARLYASTRQEELSITGWPDEQKAAFLQMQFNAQHAHYKQHFQDADWLVILRDGEQIGRLYLGRWPREHHVVDISLLPAWCGLGIGGALLRDLIDEAAAHGKPLAIHVEKMNRALRLYLRLGFRKVADEGVYDLMQSQPAAAGASAQVNTAS
jgi:GNAT superfamily N-acetyltransferase